MVPAPRFRRVAALQRSFVDRETVLDDFMAELGRIGGGPRIFNVTGVGGIGKSRLLRELKDRAADRHRTATLDLQIPALRQQEDALAVLRSELGSQGVHFDRFDIAYAVMWQRLHPHLRLDRSELAFLESSSILTDIVDTVSGLPLFGTARGLLRILERGTSDVRRRSRVRRDATLQTLDELPNSELGDAVTFLFAEDLRDGSGDKPYVLFIDTYEALVPAPMRSGRASLADAWLRDLIAQLDTGLVVVASREPLRWEIDDPEWAEIIRVCRVDGLPMPARLALLENGGITEPARRRAIAEASAGLPFYLHLAVDTHQQTGGRDENTVVSRSQILARFLQHVDSSEIRSLEVLSAARIFDLGVFRRLVEAYGLPGDQITWESLTSYSFVYPAGTGFRFHQLMRTALAARLSPRATEEIHSLLRQLWDERADRHAASEDRTARARAVREAAYHGLHAGQLGPVELLDYADRAVRLGGRSAADGITEDLRAWTADHPERTDFTDVVTCLDAEGAVRLGDAAAVVGLTPLPMPAGPTTLVGARLAVAAGHGRRIAGETRAALDIYTEVWNHGAGMPRLHAGLWAADLHMAQGRFREAETLAAELEKLIPEQEVELRGDVARLRHLAFRFAFDFEAARRHLDAAEEFYRAAGSTIGLANIETNRAEFLSLTDPADAVGAAARAVETQREIGANHELGKAYTALAVAQIRLGALDEAESSLQTACDALDRAGYRSGRARAELWTAMLRSRQNRIDEAVSSLRRAVAELEAAEVYPTFVLCAEHALRTIGVDDGTISEAARRARDQVQPFDTLDALEGRVSSYVAGLLEGRMWAPSDIYRAATERTDRASGFYNHNVRLDTPSGPVVVRIPIPGSDVMDLAIWPESAVLRAIRGRVPNAPRLLYAQENPRYQIISFIGGQLLDDIAPRGVPVPHHVIDDVADVFHQLGDVPLDHLPPLPDGWPEDGDTVGFAHRLSAVTADVHTRFLPEFGDLFADLGIPAEPLASVYRNWSALASRPFRLLHTDIHRKNMIVAEGCTHVLDWELALWGDPVYDLAVHVHKMSYQPDELEAFLPKWLAAVPGPASEGWEKDLRTYLAHERVKSAIVDTVRYTKIISAGTQTAEADRALLAKLSAKLSAAHDVWGTRRPDVRPDDLATRISVWVRRRSAS